MTKSPDDLFQKFKEILTQLEIEGFTIEETRTILQFGLRVIDRAALRKVKSMGRS